MLKFENIVLVLIIVLCVMFISISVYFMMESFGIKIGKNDSDEQQIESKKDDKNSVATKNFGTIKGRLLDVANNIFVEGIVARLCIFKTAPEVVKETKTDKDGNFCFYEVDEASGYWITFYKDNSLVATSEKISVQKDKMTDVGTISIFAGATISGNVVDTSGLILNDVSITLRVSVKFKNETSAFQNVASTTTDENGFFIFKNVPPGRYEIVFEKDGYASLSQSHITVQKGDLKELKNIKMFPRK